MQLAILLMVQCGAVSISKAFFTLRTITQRCNWVCPKQNNEKRYFLAFDWSKTMLNIKSKWRVVQCGILWCFHFDPTIIRSLGKGRLLTKVAKLLKWRRRCFSSCQWWNQIRWTLPQEPHIHFPTPTPGHWHQHPHQWNTTINTK